MADALRQLRALGQPAQHLLDEERVAVGAGVHARRDRVVAEQRARERRDIVLGEPAQPDAQQRAVALELGERAGQRAAPAQLGVAVGAEDEQRPGAIGAHQEAREQQRALVGPVQVVDDQQQAALAR